MSETGGYPEDVAEGFGEDIPERSEQLDQVQPEESLDDRGVDDVLDEGLTTPEGWSVLERGDQEETLDERLDEEVPDDAGEWSGGATASTAAGDADADQSTLRDDHVDDGDVGGQRAGRLVDEDEGIGTDTEPDMVGSDVGIDASAAGAEEAAVHVVPDSGDEEADASDTQPRDKPT